MDHEDLLKEVAREIDVEIVCLSRPESTDKDANQLTYSLRVRAAMEKLMAFLDELEHRGFRGVAIDRVTAKRQDGIWVTSIDVTGYFSAVPMVGDDALIRN